MSTEDDAQAQLRERLDRLLQRVAKMEGELSTLNDRESTAPAGNVGNYREALRRIESGSYACSTCGQPISAERLAALPAIQTCANCATT